MNRRLIAGLAFVLAAAAPAGAADLSYPPQGGYAPAAYAPFTWSGFYLGANAGYGWGDADFAGSSVDGGLIGAQAGFNWQGNSPIVLGFETDIQYSGMEGGNFSLDYFGTARLRAGYAINQMLVYGTGGLAYGGGSYTESGLSDDQTHIGWALGAGLEYAFTPNWSAKAEYLYLDLGKENYLTVNGLRDVGVNENLLRAGVNYRF
ncbi:outer membrane protein [Ancylobacter lacus]|uniref:outer membrane protein n=1 Tax=Ancylobacter lacus TaxID=2579970 RepID=UPI001BCFBA60|nr:outer membrane protein [Ancylobacter lacus]MBS7540631.1 porin family protein [Ancylobacter lacus]